MRIQFILMLSLAVSTLMGCATNGIPSFKTSGIDEAMIANTEKTFVGVPILMSAEGSTARLNSEWLVSAAYNWIILDVLYDEVYYHPTCDIALIRDRGDNVVNVGDLYEGDDAYIVGYPMNLAPISVNKGKYYSDTAIPKYQYPDCMYGVIDANSISGMSGGGTYSTDHELVGIYVGIAYGVTYNREVFDDISGGDISIFLPLRYVSEWITEVTGTNFYE
ncbi:hypothetical protein VPDG_00020 [Vibrio phage henriette 12B8]|uniref:protease n=1 Tax=Vibrio phage henriette 12B8 TaxID=573174 RepID=UPI0002C14F06|nr:protease [Vibrio phage henriette 12B8]AGG58182.1 hypothetical protein VPDG_00020 [Vibrio phage henriette 12B8]